MLASWLREHAGAATGHAPRLLVLASAGAVGCGQQNTDGRSPSYLVIETLQAASGAKPATFGGTLESDVVTNVKTRSAARTVIAPTVYEDLGQVKLRMALKDGGNGIAVTAPTPVNAVTVTRYHVDFKRSDGRNTPGVDVPYGFDGAATGTIGGRRRVAHLRARAGAGQARGAAEGAARRRRRDSCSRPSPRSPSTGRTRTATRSP